MYAAPSIENVMKWMGKGSPEHSATQAVREKCQWQRTLYIADEAFGTKPDRATRTSHYHYPFPLAPNFGAKTVKPLCYCYGHTVTVNLFKCPKNKRPHGLPLDIRRSRSRSRSRYKILKASQINLSQFVAMTPD